MKRRLQSLLVALATVSFVPMAFPTPAVAAVAEQEREVQRVVDELDAMAERANVLAEDYNEALTEQADLGIEIESAKKRVAEKTAEVDQLRDELSDVAVQSYTGTDSDVLGPLFSQADTYSEKLQSDQYRSVALDVGSVSTDDLDEVLSDLADEQAALDAALERQKELIKSIAQQKEELDSRTAEWEQKRADAEAKLGELIAQEEQRRAAAALAAAQAAAAAEAQAANNGGGGNSSSGGSSGGGGGAAVSSGGGGNSGGGSSSSSSSASSGGGSSAPAPAPAPASSGGGSAPSPSGQAGTAISSARSQLGVPYRYAASSPGEAFDCSGLTQWAWGTAGVRIPRVSRDQAAALPRVSPGSAQPGDLIFFYSPISHVGIYIGGGQMIHAPYTGSSVNVTSVSWGKVTAVGRPG